MTDERVRVKLPMVCRCGDQASIAADIHQRAMQTLNATDANFVTRAAIKLEIGYGASVSFGVDQWFGVSAKTDQDVVLVEADHLEDGLAALALWFIENREPVEDLIY